jgi:outer membrane receptor protein involved in Fe transport
LFGFTFNGPTATSENVHEERLYANTQVSDKLSLHASWYFAQGVYHVPNPNDATNNTWLTIATPYSAPRVSAVWRANSNTAIRLAAGGGFALPPLQDLVGENSSISCPNTACYQTLDNLNLAPEKSFGVDLGMDMRLHHTTVLSFDFYNTNLYGQIFTGVSYSYYNGPLCPSPPAGLPGCQLFVSQVENLGHSRYQGINLDIRHDVPKGIYWHGELGLTRGYVVSLPAGFYNVAGSTCRAATYLSTCQDTYIVPGINFDGQEQSTVPYATGSAQIGYRWSPGKFVDLEPTYYGNNNSYYVPAFVTFDAHAGYPLTKNVSLLATFRNITGIYGQALQTQSPFGGFITAPTVVGGPYQLYGLPYGVRSVSITANFQY